MSSGAKRGDGEPVATEQAVAPRLRRGARRDQILAAATRAFARAGYAATSLDDIAGEAAVTRAILYRHFASKAELYRAVLERARHRLVAATGAPPFTEASIDGLLAAAAEDPDGFRLLFQHSAREPEFRAEIDRLRADAIDVALEQLAGVIPDRAWAGWAAQLVFVVAIEAVVAWLDAGQPDRDIAAGRVRQAIMGVIQAAGRA